MVWNRDKNIQTIPTTLLKPTPVLWLVWTFFSLGIVSELYLERNCESRKILASEFWTPYKILPLNSKYIFSYVDSDVCLQNIWMDVLRAKVLLIHNGQSISRIIIFWKSFE